jgi:hypothetical protein
MKITAFKRCELNKVWAQIEGEWVHLKEEYLAHHKPQIGHEVNEEHLNNTSSIPSTPVTAPVETPATPVASEPVALTDTKS